MKKLISLEVENFKSFSNFKMELPLIKNNKNNINLILGDNGTGKSTFIDIFDFLVNFWRSVELNFNTSNDENLLRNLGIKKYNSFYKIYSTINSNEPIVIKLIINIDNKKYQYYLKYNEINDEAIVEEESLILMNDKIEKIIFEKKYNERFSFNEDLRIALKEEMHIFDQDTKTSFVSLIWFHYFVRKNKTRINLNQQEKENKSLKTIFALVTAFQIRNDFPKKQPLLLGLKTVKHPLLLINKNDPSYQLKVNEYSKTIKEFTHFVSYIDDKILNISFEEKIINNSLVQLTPIFHKKINNINVKIPYEMESTGTQKYFSYFLVAFDIKLRQQIIFYDEFGTNLQTSLKITILNYLLERADKNDVQLFLTTHDALLLNNKYVPKLSNKQKWFITKDTIGITRIKNLKNTNTRENNFEKFIRGEYGGKTIQEEIEYDGEE